MRRRDFIQIGAAWAAGKPGGAAARKNIAALSTTYHVRSHSDNFITRFLEGYWIDKQYYPSPADIVSLYMDQIHPADIGYRLSTAYNCTVTKSIADALTHTGQIAILRRMAGCPMRGENYYRAEIVAGHVGQDQAAPVREF